MDNKNNAFDDEIEIIDDLGNNPTNREEKTLSDSAEFLLEGYTKDDNFRAEKTTEEPTTLASRVSNENQGSAPTNMQEPDLLSVFNIELNDDNAIQTPIPPVINNRPILNPADVEVLIKEDAPAGAIPISKPTSVYVDVDAMNNNERAMETLNTAEISDPRLAVPQESNNESILMITKEQNKDVDNKKGAAFIVILFIILIVFIIALPQITKLVQQIAG